MRFQDLYSNIRNISLKEKTIILSSVILLLFLPLLVFVSTQEEKQKTRSQASETLIDSLNAQILENKEIGNTVVNRFLLEQRKEKMLDLVFSNPQEFLNKVMSTEFRNSFPEEQSALIEEKLTLSGNLIPVISDNFETKQTKTDYLIQTDNSFYSISFDSKPLEDLLSTVSKISLDGYVLGSRIVARNQDIKILDANKIISTKEEKNIAVWPVNFIDDRSEPWNKADISKRVFCNPDCNRSVKTYYSDVSNGKLKIKGRVLDWWKSDLRSRDMCDWEIQNSDLLLNEAKQKNPSVFELYDGIVFVHPNKSCATPWGRSTLGGNPSIAVVGQLDLHGLIHELGHSFGLAHAVVLNCSSGGCWDESDVMGMKLANMNPLHLLSLNFIPKSVIKNFTSNGMYRVFKSGGQFPQIIKIDVPNDSWDVYLDYRNPDLKYNKDVPYPLGKGILIYRWNANPGSYTKLIDITSTDNNVNNLVLTDGKTAGWVYVTIEQIRHTDNYTDIKITKN